MAGPTLTNRGIQKTLGNGLTSNDSVAVIPVGSVVIDGNNLFKYVKFLGNNAIAIGDICCYDNSDTTNFTAVDNFNRTIAAGVACCAVAAGVASFGWIQLYGNATLNAVGQITNGIVAGNNLSNTGAPSKGLKVISLVTDQIVASVLNAATPTIHCDFPWI